MSPTARIVRMTLGVSVLVGVLVAAVGVLGGESAATLRHTLMTAEGLANLLAVALASSLPMSVPAGLVGGVVASRALTAENGERGHRSWVIWGCACGSALGA